MLHRLGKLWALCVIVLLAAGCEKKLQYGDLVGRWRAFSVTEEGEPLGVDPSVITLDLLPGNRYVFNSTLVYQEAGRCRIDLPYLYTTDTTAQDLPQEKAVRVLNALPVDSLFLLMEEDNGKKRTLKLVRED